MSDNDHSKIKSKGFYKKTSTITTFVVKNKKIEPNDLHKKTSTVTTFGAMDDSFLLEWRNRELRVRNDKKNEEIDLPLKEKPIHRPKI